MVGLLVLVFKYRSVNADRERRLANGEADNFTPEELSELGDKAITFKYTL